MTDFKKKIDEVLADTIDAGAAGVVVVGPSGFPVFSSGNVKEKDREAATVFTTSLEKLSVSNSFSKNLKYLLGESVKVGKPWINGMKFEYGETFYMGAYVRGYTLLAVLRSKEKSERVEASLMASVGPIMTLFGKLSRE